MAITENRIYRTADGRAVAEGHQDAIVLAYAPGDEVPDGVLEQVEPAGDVDVETKQAKPAANKARQVSAKAEGPEA